MTTPTPLIVVTRSQELPAKLMALAHANGAELVTIAGITQQVDEEGLAQLRVRLNNGPPYAGLVITSQQGWQGVLATDSTGWANLPVVTVGEVTASQVTESGGKVLAAVDSSQHLPATLTDIQFANNAKLPWLWPCGNRPMQGWLASVPAGITVEKVLVYQTDLRQQLTDEEHQALAMAKVLGVTSPSNLEGLIACKAVLPENIVALGPTTAQAVQQLTGKPPVGIAPVPSLPSLMEQCVAVLAT